MKYSSDDIAKERKKGMISVNEVETAIREIGLENLFGTAGKAPKNVAKKKIKKKNTLNETQETIPSQIEEEHLERDKIQEEIQEAPTQEILEDATQKIDIESQRKKSISEPEIMEIGMTK